MKYYIKQHVFTLGDRFSIYDENGNERFYVEGEFLTLGKKLHLFSQEGAELVYIEQKLFSLLPKYSIIQNETEVAEVVKEFTFFYNEYSVNGLGWKVTGNFLDHEYTIESENKPIASVCKQWFTWGDTYEINISNGIDVSLVLSVVLVIDACLEADKN